MHALDTSVIFKPYVPQDILSSFEDVFSTPVIHTLFVYKKYPLSEQQRRCQIPFTSLNLASSNEANMHLPGSQDPFWFQTLNTSGASTRIWRYPQEMGNP